jgi:PKD repeat protein
MWDVGFSVDKTEGPAPLTVHVTDTSLNTSDATTQWTYTFEPGITSSERNPTYTFKNPGTYWMVQYIVKNCGQADRNVMTGKTITVNPALTVYSVTNLSMPNVTSPTTTVTTTVTPTVTTTTTWSEPVVPVYVDTRATGFVPGTTAPTAPQIASATQQGAASPAPSLAPRTPGTGTLSVATNPPGAQVFVDDVLRGLSPANIPALPAGQHTLRLEKSGYRNMTVPVSIEEGKTTDYSTGLEAESGGMGIVPIIVGVLVIAAIGGGAYWYMRKKGPGTGGQT